MAEDGEQEARPSIAEREQVTRVARLASKSARQAAKQAKLGAQQAKLMAKLQKVEAKAQKAGLKQAKLTEDVELAEQGFKRRWLLGGVTTVRQSRRARQHLRRLKQAQVYQNVHVPPGALMGPPRRGRPRPRSKGK